MPVTPIPRDQAVEAFEAELALVLRRARHATGWVAKEVHPELGSVGYSILMRIDECGGARITDLAAYLGVGKSTMSRQVGALEGLDLVVRHDDPHDARNQLVRLSAAGIARLSAVRQERQEWFRRRLTAFSDQELVTFTALLAKFGQITEAGAGG